LEGGRLGTRHLGRSGVAAASMGPPFGGRKVDSRGCSRRHLPAASMGPPFGGRKVCEKPSTGAKSENSRFNGAALWRAEGFDVTVPAGYPSNASMGPPFGGRKVLGARDDQPHDDLASMGPPFGGRKVDGGDGDGDDDQGGLQWGRPLEGGRLGVARCGLRGRPRFNGAALWRAEGCRSRAPSTCRKAGFNGAALWRAEGFERTRPAHALGVRFNGAALWRAEGFRPLGGRWAVSV